jgi:hypothetical protein
MKHPVPLEPRAYKPKATDVRRRNAVPLLSQVLTNLWEPTAYKAKPTAYKAKPTAYKADCYSNTYKFLVLSITHLKNKKLNEIFQNLLIGT